MMNLVEMSMALSRSCIKVTLINPFTNLLFYTGKHDLCVLCHSLPFCLSETSALFLLVLGFQVYLHVALWNSSQFRRALWIHSWQY